MKSSTEHHVSNMGCRRGRARSRAVRCGCARTLGGLAGSRERRSEDRRLDPGRRARDLAHLLRHSIPALAGVYARAWTPRAMGPQPSHLCGRVRFDVDAGANCADFPRPLRQFIRADRPALLLGNPGSPTLAGMLLLALSATLAIASGYSMLIPAAMAILIILWLLRPAECCFRAPWVSSAIASGRRRVEGGGRRGRGGGGRGGGGGGGWGGGVAQGVSFPDAVAIGLVHRTATFWFAIALGAAALSSLAAGRKSA